MQLPYFPGCALKTTAKHFEVSALATASELGIELIELARWNCCGTVYSLVNDNLMDRIAPVRNLIRVQEMNIQSSLEDEHRLVTFCSICYNTLKRANTLVKKDTEKREKLNVIMDREKEYSGKVKIIHYLELLRELGYDKIVETVKKPLEGLKISPYYGCLLLRPKDFAIDNLEHPTIFEELLEALDIEVVNNPYKMQCCGSYHTVENKQLIIELTYKILSYAVMNEAEAIALSCPLCAFNLDQRQEDVQKMFRDFKKIPVFYFPQLIALAFGLSEEIGGFHSHHVDPRPLLRKKNLLKT
jgi:heterodisulfide reductase subunit B